MNEITLGQPKDEAESGRGEHAPKLQIQTINSGFLAVLSAGADEQPGVNVNIESQVREILDENARLSVSAESLDDDADLYVAGMTSHASVSVMLALEDTFDVEFPDSMLSRGVFASIASISNAVNELSRQAVA